MSSDIIPLLPSPIETELPPTLIFLSNPISYYFSAAPPYNNAVLGALLFTPPQQILRLLLLQRGPYSLFSAKHSSTCIAIQSQGILFLKPSKPFLRFRDMFEDSIHDYQKERLTPAYLTAGGTDPHAFSDFWQIPSGTPKPSDPSMLHALARIISEQTGLRLSSVITMSGTDTEIAHTEVGKVQRIRMLFVVEVAELGQIQLECSPFGEGFGYGGPGVDVNSVPISLNLDTHRRHAWTIEEDLKELIISDLYPIEERAQYRMMLEAFVFHKQNLAYLDSLNAHGQSAKLNHGLHI